MDGTKFGVNSCEDNIIMIKDLKLCGLLKSCLPRQSSTFHMVGECDVMRPQIELPLQ